VNRSKLANAVVFLFAAAICLGLLGAATGLGLQTQAPQTPAFQITDELGTLASDAMLGRGSGTVDELRAARYLARELRRIGIGEILLAEGLKCVRGGFL